MLTHQLVALLQNLREFNSECDHLRVPGKCNIPRSPHPPALLLFSRGRIDKPFFTDEKLGVTID